MQPKKKVSTAKVLRLGLSQNPEKTTVPAYKVAAKAFAVDFHEAALTAFGPACRQTRTAHRLVGLLTAGLFSTSGSGTIADAIRAADDDQQDWTADYRVFSEEHRVDPIELFHGVFRAALPLLPPGPVFLAVDDTCLPKRGKKLPLARWCHNPLCPPWIHPSLQWAHPCFHAALLVFGNETHKPQAITVAFELVPGLTAGKKKEALEAALAEADKKPSTKPKSKAKKGTGKQGAPKRPQKPKAPKKPKHSEDDGRTNRQKRKDAKTPQRKGRPTKAEAERRAQEELILRAKYPSAPDVAVATIRRVREWMDQEGMQDRLLIVVGDGSYTNATVFFALPARCVYVGRCRPDAALYAVGKPKPSGGFEYGPRIDPPMELAVNEAYKATRGRFVYGGDIRLLKWKCIGPVYRKTSTKKEAMRLLILKPSSYRLGGKRYYTHEAFLLTSDFTVPSDVLIQGYLYRWAIEVAHRDMKSLAKIGKAQVRCRPAVAAAHAAHAAAFALLWVCSLKKFGAARTDVFVPVALWQRKNWEMRAKKRCAEGKGDPVIRATSVDVLTLLREGAFTTWSRGLARCA